MLRVSLITKNVRKPIWIPDEYVIIKIKSFSGNICQNFHEINHVILTQNNQ